MTTRGEFDETLKPSDADGAIARRVTARSPREGAL